MAKRNGRSPEDFVPRRIYRIRLELRAVVDLTKPRDLPAPLAELDFQSDNLAPSQAVGEATQYLGREAIRAPSAAGTGEIIAVFVDRLHPGSIAEPIDYETWETAP